MTLEVPAKPEEAMSLSRIAGLKGGNAGKGIGRSLAGLVLVAVVPLLLFGGGVAWLMVDQKKAAVADELAGVARALRVAVDHEVLGQFTVMDILATDASLDSGKLAAFQDRARRALLGNGDWLNVGLIDPRTHQIVVAAPALSSPPPMTLSPAGVDEVVRTRKPLLVGSFAASMITPGPLILLLSPVIRDNEVRYVLGVAMNPKSVNDVFTEQQLPATWTGAIVDNHMTLAGRSRDPARFIGKRATPTLANRIAASESGMFTALNQEGASVYTVFSRSPATGWSVAIGVPAAEVEGPIRRMLLRLTAAGGVLIAFALVLAGRVGRGIVRQRHAYETALQESQSRLQKSLDEFGNLVARLPLGVFKSRMLGAGGFRFEFVSARWCEQNGVSAEEVYRDARAAFRRFLPEDLETFIRNHEAMRTALQPFVWEGRLSGPQGPFWLHVESSPTLLPNGDILWNGIQYDITERKLAEQQLRIAATAFESQEGMVVTDAHNVILRVNQAFTDITGYATADVVGREISLLKSGRHDAAFYADMWGALRQQGVWRGEIWNRRKNGEIYPQWLTITAVKGTADEVTHYVGTLTDITQRKAAEDEIQHLAFYDPLTRLPNRRLLLDRLRQALAASSRSRRQGALLFIDLDNFKTLNDTLGHDTGDLLLQQVAQRLGTCVREGDTVARLGGDEFVVMLEDLSEHAPEAATRTEAVGEKIRSALNQPYLLAGHPHHSTPSIGATLFDDHHNSIDELLKRADLAMYQAKAAGRNTLRFFDPEMQAAVTARATLEGELRTGLQQHQFRLHYQPQVDEAGRVTGAEALIRWQHPRHGLMRPADFIPLAEETGQILPLGHWVLESACARLKAWAARPELSRLTLAVNVSARQFHHPDFVDQVLAVLDESGADPKKLKLELTESLLVENVADVVGKMQALKTRGVGFALDDFGTGYSSLSYLKQLPLDQLKIDKSFVLAVLLDPNDAAIARTIVALAHSMGLGVIAEGVESTGQRDFLARLDCHAFQGDLFGRPVPAEEFEGLLEVA